MINWKIRYAALLERHPELFDPERSVLEVGSGTQGIARYLNRPVVGVDREFAGAPNRHLRAVAGSVLNLPFGDDAFDDVVCVDTIEHLHKGDRLRALRELVRVAGKRVVISGPAGSFAASGDAAYAEHLARTGGSIPAWLAEHVQYGIPTLGELVDALWATGYPFTVHVNEGIIQHYAGLFADDYPFMTRFLQGHELKFPADTPLRAAPGDVPYSYQFTIDATTPRAAPPAEPPSAREGPPIVSAVQPPGALGLFAVGHRTDRMPDVPGIRSVLAGAVGGTPVPPTMKILRDDGGDSISERNSRYSEMTAIYWVWKNVKGLDAVGFCHYRRYFDFRQSLWQPGRQTDLRSPRQVIRHQEHFADRSVIDRHLGDRAIIVARPDALPMAIGEQYMWAHLAEHYLMMANYVLAHHPHLATQLVAQLSDRAFHINNMFVMPWPQFDRLCRFWFDCLFGIEEMLNAAPSAYQRRSLAFLSERLLDLHVRWLRDCGQAFAEYPIFFLQDEAFTGSA
jgi:SAM-dependent methyltransferase